MAYGAPVVGLTQTGLAVRLPEYNAAVRAGAWARRVAALSAWVLLHEFADGVPPRCCMASTCR